MKKSVVVFGLGKFGMRVATKLYDQGIDVMAVDKNYDLVQDAADSVTVASQADFLDDEVIKELGLSNFDIAVVATGESLEASIVATLAAKDAGIEEVIVKSNSPKKGRVLKKLGADRIIYPELDMGDRLARSISRSNLLEFIHFSQEYGIMEVRAKESWIGKTIREMDFRNTYQRNIIAINRQGDYIVSPKAEDVIEKGDVLILIGKEKDANNLE